jgi:hypothetical protein
MTNQTVGDVSPLVRRTSSIMASSSTKKRSLSVVETTSQPQTPAQSSSVDPFDPQHVADMINTYRMSLTTSSNIIISISAEIVALPGFNNCLDKEDANVEPLIRILQAQESGEPVPDDAVLQLGKFSDYRW